MKLSEKWEGKVNSKSDLLGNFIENSQEQIITEILDQETTNILQKIKNYLKRHFAVGVIGYSMSGVFEHGDILGAKKVTRFTRYNIGDIIVFEIGSVKVIHKIVGTEVVNGELQYRTQGVNNEQMDPWTVSRADILGKVDISKTDLNKLIEQISQGKISLIEAFGMPSDPETGLFINFFEENLEICIPEIDLLLKMYHELDFVRGDLYQIKEQFDKYLDEIYGESYIFKLLNTFKTQYLERILLNRLRNQLTSYKIDVRKLYGLVERAKIIDSSNNRKDSSIPEIVFLEQGWQDYSDPGGEGSGLAHILFRHMDHFRDIGLNTGKEIAEFILETVSSQIGVKESDGWFIYKISSTSARGEPRYIRVGIDPETGSIKSAHPYNRRIIRNMINANNYLGDYL